MPFSADRKWLLSHAFAFVFVVNGFCQSPNTRLKGPATRVLFLGTSITCGQGASRPDRAYPALLTEALKAANSDIATWNLCFGGAHSLTMWALLSERGFAWHPSLVVMEAGTLDEFYLSAEGSALEGLARSAAAQGVRMVFMHPYTSRNGYDSYRKLQAAAEQFGFAIADLGEYARKHKIPLKDVTIDTVHPNDAGHALIASAIYESLAQQKATGPRSSVTNHGFNAVAFIPAASAVRGAEGSLEPEGPFAQRGTMMLPAGVFTLRASLSGRLLSVLFDGKSGPAKIEYRIDNGRWMSCIPQPAWFPHYLLDPAEQAGAHQVELHIRVETPVRLEGFIVAE